MQVKKKLKVGITGGIGSGKTSACKCFEALNIPVYYADARAKMLMHKNEVLKNGIIQLLGPSAYHKDGQLNRAYIAQQIFNDQTLLNKMNALVHPAVRKDAKEWHEAQTSPFTLQEAALFYENGSFKKMDKMIVVYTPTVQRIQRTMLRDQKSSREIKNRINNQLSDWVKLQQADFAIYNELGLAHLQNQVAAIHEQLV